MTAQMSAATTAGLLITGPLLYYLKKSKMTGTRSLHYCYEFLNVIINRHRRTNLLINRLIVWVMNTAIIGVVETTQVISVRIWISATRTLIFLPFHLILAKCMCHLASFFFKYQTCKCTCVRCLPCKLRLSPC
ncbi:hypothetical protein BJY52DRAFT_1290643, partial [Lactarius psammicola]